MNTDRWYFRIFQSAPDLIRALLPTQPATSGLGLDPTEPADRLYRFSALELKELSHRLDGVLWPRAATDSAESGSDATSSGATGSPQLPVVLLDRDQIPATETHAGRNARGSCD